MVQTASIKLVVAIFAVLTTSVTLAHAGGSNGPLLASNVQTNGGEKAGDNDQGKPDAGQPAKDNATKREKTPEERMQARFPQPVRVGHLINLPVLDSEDSTIGHVRDVVRTPEGKIRLIVPYGKRFGWARDWWPLNIGRRLVAVPIEAVAVLARQIGALDMARADFDKAPTWTSPPDQSIPADETIKIALARR